MAAQVRADHVQGIVKIKGELLAVYLADVPRSCVVVVEDSPSTDIITVKLPHTLTLVDGRPNEIVQQGVMAAHTEAQYDGALYVSGAPDRTSDHLPTPPLVILVQAPATALVSVVRGSVRLSPSFSGQTSWIPGDHDVADLSRATNCRRVHARYEHAVKGARSTDFNGSEYFPVEHLVATVEQSLQSEVVATIVSAGPGSSGLELDSTLVDDDPLRLIDREGFEEEAGEPLVSWNVVDLVGAYAAEQNTLAGPLHL